MNREFINYEQALELKELGFDEPCFGYYQQEWHDDGMTELEPSLKMIISKQHQHAYQICTAPTFSQAFRFFRKKHNLDSSVRDLYKSTIKVGYYFDIDEYKGVKFQMDFDSWYDTYEEAELECLKKLIEICCKLK
jgi:hypothetical protein